MQLLFQNYDMLMVDFLVNYCFRKNKSIPIEVNVQERTNILDYLLRNGDLISYKEKYQEYHMKL